MDEYQYKEASFQDLERRWDKNIANNPGDNRWVAWKDVAICQNQNNILKTFVVLHGHDPVGEGTLIISPQTGAINGRLELANGTTIANINGLRVDKQYEGKGHISKLVKTIEQYAKNNGYEILTIGVEPNETRNLGIYLHWGYDTFVMYSFEEDGELVLYYSKKL